MSQFLLGEYVVRGQVSSVSRAIACTMLILKLIQPIKRITKLILFSFLFVDWLGAQAFLASQAKCFSEFASLSSCRTVESRQ